MARSSTRVPLADAPERVNTRPTRPSRKARPKTLKLSDPLAGTDLSDDSDGTSLEAAAPKSTLGSSSLLVPDRSPARSGRATRRARPKTLVEQDPFAGTDLDDSVEVSTKRPKRAAVGSLPTHQPAQRRRVSEQNVIEPEFVDDDALGDDGNDGDGDDDVGDDDNVSDFSAGEPGADDFSADAAEVEEFDAILDADESDDEEDPDYFGELDSDDDPADVEANDGDVVVATTGETRTSPGDIAAADWLNQDIRAAAIASADPVLLDRFMARVRRALTSLKELAATYSQNDFCDQEGRPKPAFSLKWWAFLLKIDTDFFVNVLCQSTAVAVQIVLGQITFDVEDLLNLETKKSHWPNLHGVYLDVLLDEQNGEHPQTYVGSSIAKRVHGQLGVRQRLGYYSRWHRKPESASEGYMIAHVRELIQPGRMYHFAILACFTPELPRPYVLLGETIFMLLLSTIQVERTFRGCTQEKVRSVTPIEVLTMGLPVGLNRTWSVNQRMPYLVPVDKRQCANAFCTTTSSKHFFSIDSTQPGISLRCEACWYYYRRHEGTERPLKLCKKLQLRKDDAGICADCGMSSFYPETTYVLRYHEETDQFLCHNSCRFDTCWNKLTDSEQYQRSRLRPDNALCVNCCEPAITHPHKTEKRRCRKCTANFRRAIKIGMSREDADFQYSVWERTGKSAYPKRASAPRCVQCASMAVGKPCEDGRLRCWAHKNKYNRILKKVEDPEKRDAISLQPSSVAVAQPKPNCTDPGCSNPPRQATSDRLMEDGHYRCHVCRHRLSGRKRRQRKSNQAANTEQSEQEN